LTYRTGRTKEIFIMKIQLRNNKDFFAGLLFIFIGLGALLVAQNNYPMGTTRSMGPGYFPIVLSIIMATFGMIIIIRGLIKNDRIEGRWGIRPLALVTLGIIVFGFLMERLGMAPSLLAMFFISALGGREFQFKEVLILSIVMIFASWLIFIYGMGVQLNLFSWSW
jgi:hypothetical protein